jgi:hypothetical protein
MKKNIKSNVIVTSNIYPILTDVPFDDPEFRKQVCGRNALLKLPFLRAEELQEWQKIMLAEDLPCSLGEDGSDYPFGPVRNDGKIKIVCRCKKETCRLFSKCRRESSF